MAWFLGRGRSLETPKEQSEDGITVHYPDLPVSQSSADERYYAANERVSPNDQDVDVSESIEYEPSTANTQSSPTLLPSSPHTQHTLATPQPLNSDPDPPSLETRDGIDHAHSRLNEIHHKLRNESVVAKDSLRQEEAEIERLQAEWKTKNAELTALGVKIQKKQQVADKTRGVSERAETKLEKFEVEFAKLEDYDKDVDVSDEESVPIENEPESNDSPPHPEAETTASFTPTSPRKVTRKTNLKALNHNSPDPTPKSLLERLQERYSHLITDDEDQVFAISCNICKANTPQQHGKGRNPFFPGLPGLMQHILSAHGSILTGKGIDLRSLTPEAVWADEQLCSKTLISDGDVEMILRGEHGEHGENLSFEGQEAMKSVKKAKAPASPGVSTPQRGRVNKRKAAVLDMEDDDSESDDGRLPDFLPIPKRVKSPQL